MGVHFRYFWESCSSPKLIPMNVFSLKGRTNTVDEEESFSKLAELEEPNTGLSTQKARSIYGRRPLPPLPSPREQPPQVDSGNHAHSDSD